MFSYPMTIENIQAEKLEPMGMLAAVLNQPLRGERENKVLQLTSSQAGSKNLHPTEMWMK